MSPLDAYDDEDPLDVAAQQEEALTSTGPNPPHPVTSAGQQVGLLVFGAFVAVGAAWFLIAGGITRDNLGQAGAAVGGAVTALIGLGAYLWSLRKAHQVAAQVTPLNAPQTAAGEPLKTADQWADGYGKHGSSGVGSPDEEFWARMRAELDAVRAPRRKLGRLPNQGRPRVKLTADLLPATVPAAPPSVDWYTKVPPTSWGMDGNDSVGDCTCAEVDHSTKARQVAAGNPEVDSSTGEVLTAYSQITGYDPKRPATDQGAEMQAVRDFWRKNGVTLGGKLDRITLFAQVDHTDLNLIKLAVQHFGAVGLGINFPASAMQQFDAGKPWTVVKGAKIEGGHAVSMIGYDAAYAYVVTWGRVQPMDWAFFGHYVEEAWTDVSADWLGPNGEDPLGEVAFALGEQFQALTGQPNPFPAPVPAPGPAPAVPADWVTWARHTLTLKGQSHATVTVAGEIVAAAGQP